MLDERVTAALIGACVVAAGWLVSAAQARTAHAREHERERRRALRDRLEQMEDVQRALKAEVMSYVAQLAAQDLRAHEAEMVAQMEREAEFVPFVPRIKHDSIFETILPDIRVLETEIVRPVTFYYAHMVSLTMMVEDLRSAGFKALPAERRVTMFRHYISMLRVARQLGMNALEALDLTSDERVWLNSLGPDHSDPETGA